MQEAGGPIPCMLCAPARSVVDAGEGCLVQSSLQREGGREEKTRARTRTRIHEPRSPLTGRTKKRARNSHPATPMPRGPGPTYGVMITCVV